jgi:phage-related protein
MAVPVSELQSVAPSAIIELFQLELNTAQHGIDETYYFHAGSSLNANGEIIWAGQPYMRWPIEATGFEYSGGQLPRPTLRVANVMATITAIMLTLPNGLEGAKVTRIRTLARYLDGANFPDDEEITYLTTLSGLQLITLDNRELTAESGGGGTYLTTLSGLELLTLDGRRISTFSIDTNPLGTADPTAEFPREIFYIDRKASENIEAVEFELCAIFDLAGVRAPKRQCIGNICQWAYRGTECTYNRNVYFDANDNPVATLAQDVCGKRLSSCEIRFQQQRHAGSVTVGSNIITLDQAEAMIAGDPVTGFGLPAGTTVSSVAGNLVTVSQNATASTNRSTTGTVQGDLTQIIVTDATGIAPGMTVTGTYLAANTQVVAVSGTTLTISPPVPVTESILALTATRTTNRAFRESTNKAYFSESDAISIGWYAASSLLPLSRLAQVTSIGRGFFGSSKAGLSSSKVAFLSQTYNSGPSNITWKFYAPGSILSATYTFFATNRNYTFKADAVIPYGSFPGIGTFFT